MTMHPRTVIVTVLLTAAVFAALGADRPANSTSARLYSAELLVGQCAPQAYADGDVYTVYGLGQGVDMNCSPGVGGTGVTPFVVSSAGSLTNLSVSAEGYSGSVDANVIVNGSTTVLSCSLVLTSSAPATCSDASPSHSVKVNAGDTLQVQLTLHQQGTGYLELLSAQASIEKLTLIKVQP